MDALIAPVRYTLVFGMALLLALAACTHEGRNFEEMDDIELSEREEASRNVAAASTGTDALDEFLNSDIKKEDTQALNQAVQAEAAPLPDWDKLEASEITAPPPGPEALAPVVAANNVEAAEPVVNPSASEAGLLAPPIVENPEPAVAPAAAAEPEPTKAAPTPKAKARSPKLTMPKKVVFNKGQSLNRYYFVRKGDTPESLSRLFYGDAEHGTELVSWNGPKKNWKPGKFLMYVSAWQPDDTNFLSFYEEQGISPEKYVLRPGESLKDVAKNRYGNPGSWKEIALVNKLNKDKGKAGLELDLYPANPVAVKVREIAETAMSNPAPIVSQVTVPPSANSIALPSPDSVKPVAKAPRSRRASKLASGELQGSSLFTFALWAFLLSSALCMLLVWQYKKAKENEEFIE